jgi:DNA polymerase-3 subunit delta'
MDIDWLSSFTRDWQARLDAGRPPHAVMLTGRAGTGKRAAAAWLVATRSGKVQPDTLPVYPVVPVEHPDVYWVTREEDRQSIRIDQVRSLVADLALTSYTGRGKTAVIEPADLMNSAAANSLLKTLEEPAGDALLVLVVDRMGRLPATIVSRCQRIDFGAPPREQALAWLNRFKPTVDWPPILEAAGGAPLEAIRLADRLDFLESLATDFRDVAMRRSSPIEIAQRWAKEDVYEILEWLARQVEALVHERMVGGIRGTRHTIDQTVLERIDSRNLFCYLDIINRLRSRPAGSFNGQTALEGLLIDWADGLEGLRNGPAGLEAMYAAG